MAPPADPAPEADPAAAFTAATVDLLAAWQQAAPALRRSVAPELRQQLAALCRDLRGTMVPVVAPGEEAGSGGSARNRWRILAERQNGSG